MPHKTLKKFFNYKGVEEGVELAWRSGNVMDCHATARGSILGRNGVFIELHVLRKGPSLNDLAVDGTLNTTNQPIIRNTWVIQVLVQSVGWFSYL